MTKFKEITDPNSCLNRASDDEPVFVLRAKDPIAILTIAHWIAKAGQYGLHKDKLLEAYKFIKVIQDWREAHNLEEL